MEVSQEELTQIRLLEERLHRPEIRQSKETVENLLAHGFVEFGSSGTVYDDKDDLIALLAAESPDPASPPVIASDYAFRAISPDVVLVTYRTIDESIPRHVLRSSIWQRIDGRWQMIFHQGTPTAPRP
ncbi:DUF4440 domain-containing protein [Rhizobium sp. P38BS-XIX]|uniref:nuclear transport factor 2 family protein n=1 Tax=Rhizobium sp. P38BS-XIX TaxID=2726740 RepID=UPI001456E9D1|nr:DUF4440 domain-containing protein [Rhizobium sp. P38BS-XIX]NLR96639.1 DUF4440 domain-containing protein [Rhizobium sp. P38BS-XIX]